MNCKAIKLASFILLSTTVIQHINGANILGVFPTASYSHQQPMLALSNALAAKGHNVTILTTNPQKRNITNLREIDLSSMYEDWNRMQNSGVLSFQERGSPFSMIRDMCGYFNFTTGAMLEKPQFKRFLKEVNDTSIKYDLMIYEGLMYSSLLGIREMIGYPPAVAVITINPLPNADDPFGNPSFPSYIPSTFFGHDDQMTFWERVQNIVGDLYIRYKIHTCILPLHQKYLNKYFSNVKRTAEELEFDNNLLIVSTDLATSYPRPIQPNTVHVGPMHVQEHYEPLTQDLQKWMDEAEEGVIYFSLGSNMQGTSVPEHIRTAFIKAFKQFPKVRVLWKWESDSKLPGQPDNVLVKKWLPQKSIFAHPKVKVFISQVGLQSFQEAIENAIPILGVPLFGDQDFNAKKLLRSGAGLRLEFSEITYEEVHEKLKSLLTDPSFKKNMLRLSSITEDKPMSAIDTAVWWCEYVIRHNGAPHLRPASLNLSWYQYYMLDILLFVFIILLIIVCTIYFTVRRLMCMFCSFNGSKNIKVKKN